MFSRRFLEAGLDNCSFLERFPYTWVHLSDSVQHVEVPVPAPAKDQVLVKVEAASVNPVDWKIQDGFFKLLFPAKFPHIPGATHCFVC